MRRFHAPAVVQLRRAQLTLVLATLVPTVLMLALGIILIALGRDTPSVVSGLLVVALCTSLLTGSILGSVFVSRGASVARFQNDFLSSVSHELRTPLTSISMFIETLRDHRFSDPKERDQCLGLLDQEVRRLQGLVERLLQLSAVEAGRHPFERRPVQIAAVVGDAVAAFEAASINDPTPVIVGEVGDHTITGDRQALAQAVTNLLINAWKYSNEKDRRIELEVVPHSRWIDICVTDNGPGIARSEQRVIFDQFERGRQAIDSTSTGSGLGLAIVRAVAKAHGGRIDLRSKPGHGSEFRLRLRTGSTP